MAKLKNFTIQVRAHKTRDLDQQSDNLQKIDGYINLDYEIGWFGAADWFYVTFSPSADVNTVCDECEKAVRLARRVKSNDNSEVRHDESRRWFKRIEDRASKTMRIYYTHVD